MLDDGAQNESGPIPARCLEPWVADNAEFITNVITERRKKLEAADEIRRVIDENGDIKMSELCERATLAAVDAAIVPASIGDMISLLIQGVRVEDDGTTIFSDPIRETGIDGYEMSLCRTPLRVMTECKLLMESTSPTIADLSFWTLLMDTNQVITSFHNIGSTNHPLRRCYEDLVLNGDFLAVIRNEHVIAMSKTNQSVKLAGQYISDREMLGRILRPGEFLRPKGLADYTQGKFGIESRGWNDNERKSIKKIYDDLLGVTYFKPHPWSRAYRIEARLKLLEKEGWIMPLLAAVSYHTKERTVEPWPQFMADFNAKQIAPISSLYGEMNFHRTPYFDPSRTIRPHRR